jgi:hypothetical protein
MTIYLTEKQEHTALPTEGPSDCSCILAGACEISGKHLTNETQIFFAMVAAVFGFRGVSAAAASIARDFLLRVSHSVSSVGAGPSAQADIMAFHEQE